MNSIIIVSLEHRDKEEILKKIIEFGKRNKFRIIPEEQVALLGNLALCKEIDDNHSNYLEFSITEKDDFKTQHISNSREINGKRYYFFMGINFNKGNETTYSMNEFLNEILSDYPDMLVTEEACEDFYSFEQIKKKQVPKWLLI